MSQSLTNILFICTGNTCRSPMAEGLLRKQLKGDLFINVSSAGVAASNGSSASAETRHILTEHGVNFTSFKSQQVTEELLTEADYVFCMSHSHRQVIINSLPEFNEKVLLLGEFLDGEIVKDIFDPYGMGASAYKSVEKELLIALKNIESFIRENLRINKEVQ